MRRSIDHVPRAKNKLHMAKATLPPLYKESACVKFPYMNKVSWLAAFDSGWFVRKCRNKVKGVSLIINCTNSRVGLDTCCIQNGGTSSTTKWRIWCKRCPEGVWLWKIRRCEEPKVWVVPWDSMDCQSFGRSVIMIGRLGGQQNVVCVDVRPKWAKVRVSL